MNLILFLLASTHVNSDNVWNSFTFSSRPSLRFPQNRQPRPLRVFSTGSTLGPDLPDSPSSTSQWMQLNGSPTINCTGLLRYGSASDNVFSLPIVTNSPIECNVGAIHDFLWRNSSINELEAGSSCQCRRQLPLRLTMRGRCLATPQTGWISPGLVDCKEGQYMVGEWKFNPVSGQLRSGSKCLSAFPYNVKESTSWKPWGVRMSDCLDFHNPSVRQSWSVPFGVGTALSSPFSGTSDPASQDGPHDWIPSGHVGRIVLRDSWDIGPRCLDISLSPQRIPTSLQVVFLEAPLCDDARIQSGDHGMWRFWVSPNATESDMNRANNWEQCSNGDCNNCDDDDEYRAYWLPSPSNNFTDTVSVPAGFSFSKTRCDIFSIRRIAINPSLANHANSTCFCQAIPAIHSWPILEPGSISWGGIDDLPTTQSPPLVAANVTKSKS